jgi:hypothetical protein
MGLDKFRRPILAPKGLQIGPSGSTFLGPVVLSGSSACLTLNAATYGVTAAAQTLSAKTAVDFITIATSGAGRDFILPAPVRGRVKHIFVDNQSTSVDTVIHTNATATVFWGTTYNTASLAAASTGSPGGTAAGTVALHLIGASTSQWAVTAGSTFNWDFAASTGSTATA